MKTVRQTLGVPASELERLARSAFKRANYRGNDGALFWKIAALLHTNQISEFEFCDVLEAANRCQPERKPAYVLTCFRELLSKRNPRVDADALLRAVRVTPNCPTSAPPSEF